MHEARATNHARTTTVDGRRWRFVRCLKLRRDVRVCSVMRSENLVRAAHRLYVSSAPALTSRRREVASISRAAVPNGKCACQRYGVDQQAASVPRLCGNTTVL